MMAISVTMLSSGESSKLGMSYMHNGSLTCALTKKCCLDSEIYKKHYLWIVILYDDIPL